MASEINPSLTPTKSLSNFRFWCQKVLPLVYDDSLSYYEVLGKMVVQLNDVIDDINADTENVLTLKDAFLDLQTYVNEFFDDIDQLASYAERAEAAQTAANASAINAATSASNASASSLAAMDARDTAVAARQAAQASANTASTAATNANTKANEAAQSAITAQTAQASASQSATVAATDRSAAQTAASTATNKANEANTSATNAETSAENAAQSEANAEELVNNIQENLDNIQQNTQDISDLKESLFQGVEKFDFSKLSSTYYTYDGYTLNVIANDTRAEATIPIAQRYHLEAGKKYVLSADYVVGLRIFLYEPTTRTFAVDLVYDEKGYTIERTFIPPVTGDYVIKANIGLGSVHKIDNPIVMWFNDWERLRGIGVTVKLYDGVADDVSINRAILFANIHKFPTVFVPQKNTGNYTITSPIIMRSNVTLKIADGATLVLSNGANCPIVQNANMTATSSDTKTDKNITIIGGVWNGNGSNQEKWTTVNDARTLTVLFKFSGVDNLSINNCTLENSQTYAFLGCNIDKCTIDGCTVNVGTMAALNNCDGIHFLGKCYNITVKNCSIHSEDNCIAFNADDSAHGYACFDGDIENIKLYNNTITNTDGAQGLLFISATHHLYNVVIDGLYGAAGYCFKIDNFAMFNGSGDYQNFDIRNVDFVINKNADYAIRLRGIMRNIKLHNIKLKYLSKALVGSTSTFTVFDIRNSIDSDTSQATITRIYDLEVDGIEIVHNWADMEMFVFQTGYTPYVNKLTINRFYILDPTGTVCPVFLSQGAIVNMLYGDDWNVENIPYGFIRTYGTGTLNRLFLNSLKTDFTSLAGLKLTHNLLAMEITGVQTDYFYTAYAPQLGTFGNMVIYSDYLFREDLPTYYRKGQIITTANNSAWLCTQSGSPLTTAWEANHAYSRGQSVRAESGDVLICIKAGTSGESLTVGYADFDDGSCRWRKLFNGVAQFVQLTAS